MFNGDSDWLCERTLLLFACITLISGVTAVGLTGGTLNLEVIARMGLDIVVILTTSYFIRFKIYRGDPLILPLTFFLSSIGITMLYRLKLENFTAQSLWLSLGVIAFAGTVYFLRDIEKLAQYKYVCGAIGVALLLVTLLFGVDINGNKNWISFGTFNVQPAEIAKLFIILFLAAYLGERSELLVYANRRYGPFELPPPRFIAPLLCLWGMTMVMLVIQRDLGAALMFFGITIGMAYLASGRLSYVYIGLGLFFIGSVLCYKLYGHVQTRVDIWLDPWQDPSNRAYQIVQSLFALGSGGILGSGLTYGYPTMIPEVHTDFIFAAIGEELGFAGAAAVMIAYILLIYRAFKIAISVKNRFKSLVAGGIAVFLSLQVFLIIGGVTKFFPLTGITLPFISYGGSSMISNYILFAVLYVISEVRPQNES